MKSNNSAAFCISLINDVRILDGAFYCCSTLLASLAKSQFVQYCKSDVRFQMVFGIVVGFVLP
jgi:hypothetical protein